MIGLLVLHLLLIPPTAFLVEHPIELVHVLLVTSPAVTRHVLHDYQFRRFLLFFILDLFLLLGCGRHRRYLRRRFLLLRQERLFMFLSDFLHSFLSLLHFFSNLFFLFWCW